MLIFSLILSALSCLITLTRCQNISYYEQAIQQAIFNSYSSSIRPTDNVQVSVLLRLSQVIGLNEPTETVTTSSYLFLMWNDPRLSWNSSLYGGITYINLLTSQLWLPDLYVINTADSKGFISFENYRAYLISNGLICMNIGLIGLATRCQTNIYKFPNDKQTCSIVIGSWFQDISRITIVKNEKTPFGSTLAEPYLSNYVKNSLWDLENINVTVGPDSVRFMEISYTNNYYFNFTIQRKPAYYLYNGIYPCLILNAITIFTFFFPFNIQASLTITTFLNMATISLRLSSEIPVQSEVFPLISLYFMLSIFYTFLSLIWFSICEQFKTRKYVPACFKSLARRFHRQNPKIVIAKPKQNEENNEEISQQVASVIPAKEIKDEAIISFLNHIACFCMFFMMFISYLVIWLVIFY